MTRPLAKRRLRGELRATFKSMAGQLPRQHTTTVVPGGPFNGGPFKEPLVYDVPVNHFRRMKRLWVKRGPEACLAYFTRLQPSPQSV